MTLLCPALLKGGFCSTGEKLVTKPRTYEYNRILAYSFAVNSVFVWSLFFVVGKAKKLNSLFHYNCWVLFDLQLLLGNYTGTFLNFLVLLPGS